ncbi:uncharacterized protein LOC124154738 [Ischnura elegans]|uniref:uncharacterized protein LOC124154738 n=1 Tax=Ischnura elegans TaxID=197161 RepID=UPI001ED8A387|nr:uncharacterized protein LOC124154738 [Ischnura elegans]
MSKFWTQESVNILIEEIRRNEFMYDTKQARYHNRNARRGVLEKIQELQTESRPNTTIDDIKCKWNSLRTQFMGEINKLKMPSGSGGGSSSTMWCFESLLFLRDHITARKSFSTMKQPEISGVNAFLNIEETDAVEDVDSIEFLDLEPSSCLWVVYFFWCLQRA